MQALVVLAIASLCVSAHRSPPAIHQRQRSAILDVEHTASQDAAHGTGDGDSKVALDSLGRLDSSPRQGQTLKTASSGELERFKSEIPRKAQKLMVGDTKFVAALILAVGLASLVALQFCSCGIPLRASPTDGELDQPAARPDLQASATNEGDEESDVGTGTIIALTFYRFYTGFLGATWLPYLIAKEGQFLVLGQQTLFMGMAKLIYGGSTCLNPFFGIISDRYVGRSFMVLVGVLIEVIGIYASWVASISREANWYLAAIFLWMLGEAMVDVTTETVVPELLPKHQYDFASSIRSLHFLAGGLSGYLTLIACGNMPHTFLYVTYAILMLLCTCVAIVPMRRRALVTTSNLNRLRPPSPVLATLIEAYVAPMRFYGGFPRACVCLFVFSLGTAPIFFCLLMVRDLVGLSIDKGQQLHFSCNSIVFLVCAAISSVLVGASSDNEASSTDVHKAGTSGNADGAAEGARPSGADAAAGCQSEQAQASHENEAKEPRLRVVEQSCVAFGLSILVLPLVSLPGVMSTRLLSFYACSMMMGLSFGACYASFQTYLWILLPNGVDVANAMGFAAVAKVIGCGLGNFLAGLILYCFQVDETSEGNAASGYVAMCVFCAIALFSSVSLMAEREYFWARSFSAPELL